MSEVGPSEAGPAEAGPSEAGPSEAGPSEAGLAEAGLAEAGPAEAGPAEAGPAEAGPSEANPSAPNPVAKLYHATVLPGNASELITEALESRPWWSTTTPEGRPWNFWWGGNGQNFDWEGGLLPSSRSGRHPRQLVNQLSKHAQICTKHRLAVNLRRWAKAAKLDPSSVSPLSFVVEAGKKDAEYTTFLAKAAEAAAAGRNMWIVKPGNNNRGRGIVVCDSADAVQAHLAEAKEGGRWVVQKYMENPLLLGGRKFDIRQYVLLTPDLRCFMYRDSYVRTSATPYDASSTDRAVHLTNDYVQKNLESFGAFEDANKLSFPELQSVLDAQPLAADGRVLSVEGELWPAMRRCVAHVFGAVLPEFVTAASHGRGFELFGLDFMVDDTGLVQLIEINTSPALFRRGRHLSEMLPRLIEETLQRCLDPLFPPPPGATPPPQLDSFELVELSSPTAAAKAAAAAAAAAATAAAAAAIAGAAGAAPATASPPRSCRVRPPAGRSGSRRRVVPQEAREAPPQAPPPAAALSPSPPTPRLSPAAVLASLRAPTRVRPLAGRLIEFAVVPPQQQPLHVSSSPGAAKAGRGGGGRGGASGAGSKALRTSVHRSLPAVCS